MTQTANITSRHLDAVRGTLDRHEGRRPGDCYRVVAHEMSRDEFDRAVWELVRRQVAFVLRHDFPARLSPERRADCLTNEQGQVFNVLGLRS